MQILSVWISQIFLEYAKIVSVTRAFWWVNIDHRIVSSVSLFWDSRISIRFCHFQKRLFQHLGLVSTSNLVEQKKKILLLF